MKAAYTKPFLTALLIVIADQLIKIWVHHNMFQAQEIKFLGDRGMLHYTENNGMAFGMELGGDLGKLVLTLFRIFAVIAIGYGLRDTRGHGTAAPALLRCGCGRVALWPSGRTPPRRPAAVIPTNTQA